MRNGAGGTRNTGRGAHDAAAGRPLATLLATTAVIGLCAAGPAVAQDGQDRLQGEAAPHAGLESVFTQLAQAGQPAPAAEERRFDIPPQPLAAALAQFGRQAGLQVAVDSGLVSGLQTPGVQGSHTVEEALRRLLAGTGLQYRFTAADTVTLQRAEAREEQGPQRLGPVTVTARRTEQSLSTIPGSVTVIETETVQEQARISPDVGKILEQTVPGFVGADGTRQQNTTIRGREALVLVNGVPQNQQLRSAGFDFRAIDPNLIERIEVVRGANATYGFGGTGGVINIITRRPISDEPQFTTRVRTSFAPLELRADSFTKEVYQDVQGRYERFDYFLGGSFRRLERAFDADGDVIPDSNTEFNNDILDLNASLGFEIDTEQSLRLIANYFRDQARDGQLDPVGAIVGERKADTAPATNDPSFPTGKFNDPQTSINVTGTYDHADVFGSAVSVQGFWQQWENKTFSDFREFGACCVLDLGPDERIDRRIGFRINVDTPIDVVLLPEGSRLTWGADGLNYFSSEGIQSEIAGEFAAFRPDLTQNSLAGFAQIEVPIGDFLVSGGIRHEEFDVKFDSDLTSDGTVFDGGNIRYSATLYNVGLVYFLNDAVELFGGFSQGFDVTQAGRAASAVDSVDLIRLEPAVADQFEVGTRVFEEDWQASLSAFYTKSDLASRTQTNPDGSLAIPLRQPERVWGVEATLDFQPFDHWGFGGIAAYQEGLREDVDGDTRRLQSRFITPLRFTGYGEYRPDAWWSSRLQFAYTPGFDRHPGSTAFGEGEVDGVFLVDAYAALDIGPGQLEIGIENLLNNQYIPVVRQATNLESQYFAGRGLAASVSYTMKW